MIAIPVTPPPSASDTERQQARQLLLNSFKNTANQIITLLVHEQSPLLGFQNTQQAESGNLTYPHISQISKLTEQLKQNPDLWNSLQQAKCSPSLALQREAMEQILMDHWKNTKVFQAYGQT